MRAQRGFTLVELLTGVAVSSIILVAVAGAVIGISGAYSNESQTRGAVEGGRTALAFIERNLKMAGYGLEPQYAFVMSDPPGLSAAKDNYDVPGAKQRVTTDDLAFRYRDPSWVRRGGAGTTSSSFTFEGSTTAGKEFPVGSAFMIACPGGSQRAWFRSTSAVNTADASIPLVAYGTTINAPSPTALDCLGLVGESAPYVFHIREFRFRLFVDGNGRGFLGYVPNLRVNLSGGWPDVGQVLTSDVEEFHVAYQMNRPLPNSAFAGTTAVDNSGNRNWVLMDAASEDLPTTSVTMPLLDDAYDTQNRYNAHIANIRAVRVNFSVRSPRQRTGKALGFPRLKMENGPDGAAGDGYFRSLMSTAVRCPNMTSRAFFLPPLISAGTTDGNDDGA